MKHCPSCDLEKEDTEFGKNKARKDGLQVHCRSCTKHIQHSWYVKHKASHYEHINKRRRERADEIAANILDYLKSHPCTDCGESDPLLLQFDHVNGTKTFTIGERTAQGYSWNRIREEIEKCEVRCMNCHWRKTARSSGFRRAVLLDH